MSRSLVWWNSSIREAVNQGHIQEALHLFRQMKQNGIEPNNLTFPIIAKACGKLSNLQYAPIIHTHVTKSPFQSDKYVQTALVDMYMKCNHREYAHKLFDRMPEKDIASWNSMLLGVAQVGGFHHRVVVLYNQMMRDSSGTRPDSVTIIGLTQSVTNDVKLLNGVHSLGIRIGVEANVSVANTWVSSYAKCGDLASAERVFHEIDSGSITVVSWNSMIAGCAQAKKSSKAISFYKQMLCVSLVPDVSTILNLVSSFERAEKLCQGKMVHSHGIKLGCVSNISLLNTLISMYSKCGDITYARLIFDNMGEKTCVSWTAMIGGYAEKGDFDEAFSLFNSMEATGEKPDLVTLLYLISGCGRTGALEVGRWFDNYAISNAVKSNVMVSNALIDMYAKCGSIRDARELFQAMQDKTIVSWSTMIAGFALNGEFREALEHFILMLELGLRPNHLTFLAVLQTCNHAGLVEKGWECFELMTKVYRLDPGLDHYSCMVDLLGRKGRLNKALEFIENMPIEPDAGIWGALLGACKLYNNMEIAEYAAHRLLEFEPQAAAPYVEMANIYALAGRWEGVAAMRTLMRYNRVRKSPGQSTVQVNGRSHTFTVEDRCHPENILIQELLNALAFHLTEELDSSISEGSFSPEID